MACSSRSATSSRVRCRASGVRSSCDALATNWRCARNEVRASSFGFIFQTFNLVPTLTAAENAEAALIPLGVPHARRRERVEKALASVGLGDGGASAG